MLNNIENLKHVCKPWINKTPGYEQYDAECTPTPDMPKQIDTAAVINSLLPVAAMPSRHSILRSATILTVCSSHAPDFSLVWERAFRVVSKAWNQLARDVRCVDNTNILKEKNWKLFTQKVLFLLFVFLLVLFVLLSFYCIVMSLMSASVGLTCNM